MSWRIRLAFWLIQHFQRVRHDIFMNAASKKMNTPLVFMNPPPIYVADSYYMVPDCLKLLPDSFSDEQTALYLRVASSYVVLLCLVLSGVVLSCLVFNGLLFYSFLSCVVKPCLVLSGVLFHTNPLHSTSFIMSSLTHTSVSGFSEWPCSSTPYPSMPVAQKPLSTGQTFATITLT